MLKVGQTVWYVPPGYGIAIECQITEVDDQWRKQHPEGIPFYEIDEPVGHSLDETEFFLSKEQALDFIYEKQYSPCSLEEYRKKRIQFIVSTWKLSPEETKVEEEILMNHYVDKQWCN